MRCAQVGTYKVDVLCNVELVRQAGLRQGEGGTVKRQREVSLVGEDVTDIFIAVVLAMVIVIHDF